MIKKVKKRMLIQMKFHNWKNCLNYHIYSVYCVKRIHATRQVRF